MAAQLTQLIDSSRIEKLLTRVCKAVSHHELIFSEIRERLNEVTTNAAMIQENTERDKETYELLQASWCVG